MADRKVIRSELVIPLPFISNDLADVMSEADHQSLLGSIQSQMDKEYLYVKLSSRVLLKLPAAQLTAIPNLDSYNVRQLMKTWKETPADLYKTVLWAQLLALEGKRDQTIVFLGESGSGKTEAFMASLQMIQQMATASTEISAKIDASQLIIREFASFWSAGNRSASASGQLLRFGLDFRGSIQTVSIAPLMIVKSPVGLTKEEGNFRIFQTLITGLDTRSLKALKLKRNYENYRSLPEISFSRVEQGESARLAMQKLQDSLKLCGFEEWESKAAFELLAALLKMGNVRVRHSMNFDGSSHKSLEPEIDVQEICQLLQCDLKIFSHCFMEKTKGEQINDTFESRDEAERQLVHFGLLLYNRLFLWIISKLNKSMTSSSGSKLKFLNLFDTYGFANLQENHLQQLIINYTNEVLVDLWHQDCIRDDQDRMISEGLNWRKLEESETCDSVKFLDNQLKTVVDGHNCFSNFSHKCSISVSSNEDSQIIMSHFGRKVSYKLDSWCSNTSASLSFIAKFVTSCNHPLLRLLFPQNSTEEFMFGEVNRKLWDQFKLPLNSIIETMEKSQRHYVFCVSPSEIPRDSLDLNRQIIAARLLPMFSIAKFGFMIGRSYGRFYQRYRMLSVSTWPIWKGNFRQGTFAIVQSQMLNPIQYAYGKTQVLFRCEYPLILLETRRNKALYRLARILQRSFRAYRLNKLAKCQTAISACYKAFKVRKKFRSQRQSAIIIQSYFRGWKERSSLQVTYKVKAAHTIVSLVIRRIAIIYLKNLATNLPSPSPIAMQWPPAKFSYCKAADSLLRILYHRWRCHKYRANIDQQTYFRMREKLAASIIFKGKKLGYKRSVCHPFMGDYIKIRQNHKWSRLAHELQDDYVVFADAASKIKVSSGKVSAILVVVTTKSFIVLDSRSIRLKYRTPAKDILKISASPFADNVCILHTLPNSLSRDRSDFVFECRHIVEVVAKVFLVIQNVTGKSPIVDISSHIWLESEEEPIEIVFKGADEESLNQSSTGCFSSPSSSLRFSVSALPKALTHDVTSLDSDTLANPDGDKNHVGNFTNMSPSNSGFLMQKVKFVRKGSRVEVRV